MIELSGGSHTSFVKRCNLMTNSQKTCYQAFKTECFLRIVSCLQVKEMDSSSFSQQGMYLRDVLDDLSRRKLRDVVDFEWKRNIRFYGTDNSRAPGECTSEL